MRGKCCFYTLYVRDSSFARRVVSLDKELYSTLSLFTQEYKWVPATYCWGNPAMDQHSVQGGVEVLLGIHHATEVTGKSSGRLGRVGLRLCAPLPTCVFYLFSSTIINSIPGKIWTSLRPAPSYKQSIWRGIQYGKTRRTGGKLNFICQMLHRQMPRYVAKKSLAPLIMTGHPGSHVSRDESHRSFLYKVVSIQVYSVEV